MGETERITLKFGVRLITNTNTRSTAVSHHHSLPPPPNSPPPLCKVKRSIATPTAITDLGLGSILSGGGSKPIENAKSSDWADMVDVFQAASLKSRLGIPIFYGSDAIHDNNNVYGATIFPHNIGLGATRL
ncbi:hypothetical protein L2E82_02881 [Cichorium intybus]|uniref:Uncharacterized protein n=1 Tax=Cichorium intybus TaxID=13427 RepID=A0ACB9H411_CICIN|nr:hypothetical protein L2E82_02881 [Cichorium intybus]